MKQNILIFAITIIMVLCLTACGDIKLNNDYSDKAEYETQTIAVTDISGEAVTNKSGETVTEVAVVKSVEKEVKVPVTNRNGETVTKANGEVITETKTVTEYVTVPEKEKKEALSGVDNKSSTTAKSNTAKSHNNTTKEVITQKPAETTKATTKPVTTTKAQETTTIANKKTAADLTYRNATSVEQELLEKINASRIEAGVQPVVWDKTLTALADIRCKEFMSNHLLAHTRPDGTDWNTVFEEYSITNYGNKGENLLSRTGLSSTKIHNSFMDSPSHKQNILMSGWNRVGISIIYNADTNFVFVCEIFSTVR